MTNPNHGLPTIPYEALYRDPAFIAAQEGLVKALQHARQNQYQDELLRRNVAQVMHNVLVPYAFEMNAHIAQFQQQLLARLDNSIAQTLWGHQGQVMPPAPTLIDEGLKLESDHFKVFLDIKSFHPKDVNVLFANNGLQVQATSVTGNGIQQLCRQYFLPRPVRLDLLEWNVSPNGLLCIAAPWKF